MAITDSYATVGELKKVFRITTGDRDEVYERVLEAVTAFIAREAGQFFTKDAAVVDRRFLGDGSGVLRLANDNVPGIATATGLVVKVDEDGDGTAEETWAATDYELLPFNALLGPDPRPFDRIMIPTWSDESVWPKNTLITITAVWGWPAVPKVIQELCITFAATWLKMDPFTTGTIQELDQTAGISPLAFSLPTRFKHAYSKVTF